MNHIDRLMREMSLAEKLGQLTMTTAGYTVTGPIIAGDSTESIRQGTVGNLFNLTGAAHVREMQRLAVEESRLGVPLLFGFDVIHGFRTIFPIPLAGSGSVRPGHLGADGTGGGKGSRGRRAGDDLRSDAGCGPGSALGAYRRGPRRRSLAGRAHCRKQSAWIPGRGPCCRRRARGGGQALLRPMVPRPRDATTRPRTSRSAPCGRSICRRLPRPWRPELRR